MILALKKLLEASIAAWHLDAAMSVIEETEIIELRSGQTVLRVSPASAGMPFRWIVTVDGRRRTAASVNGVLRIVRQTFSPGYEPHSMRIAAPSSQQRTPL